MIFHDVTDVPRSRNLCPDCEATPAGCRGVRALRGTRCCSACDERGGDHDVTRPEGGRGQKFHGKKILTLAVRKKTPGAGRGPSSFPTESKWS